MRWKIAVLVPENDFVGEAKQSMIIMLLISTVMLALAVFLAFLVSRSITSPVRLISEATAKMKGFNLDEKSSSPLESKKSDRKSDAVHRCRRDCMPSGICAIRTGASTYKHWRRGPIGRAKNRTDRTVFRYTGFTSIAELMAPEQLMLHLSEYFDELTKILTITEERWISISETALWLSGERRSMTTTMRLHACEAGLACQEKISELNRKWIKEGKSALVTRIGISTGQTVVGNVGSPEQDELYGDGRQCQHGQPPGRGE